jgi:hypothetical protein
MNIGDSVIWRGRIYRLLGFDPMSVPERRAHLEDEQTGDRVAVPASEIEELPPAG